MLLKKIYTIVASLLILVYGAGLFLLLTPKGKELRELAAGMVLSSQHRDYSKYTFVPKDELDDMLASIETPSFVNTSEHSITKDIQQSLETVTGTTRQSVIVQPFLPFAFPFSLKEEEELSQPLRVSIEDIQRSFSDHYFKGRLMIVSNPLNVRIASSKGEQLGTGYGEQIQVIANREGAIGATNASGFVDENGNGTGGKTIGIVISNGEVVHKGNGMNAATYTAGITQEGVLVTGFYSPNELLALQVKEAAGFKPQLLSNGEKMITTGDGGWGYGPRTAIGQTKKGELLLLVIDGRQAHSIGASMKDIQDLLYEYGAVNAMAMDGGSSSSMYFNGEHLTTPSSLGHVPRYLPNAWVVVPDDNQAVELFMNGQQVNRR